MAYNWQSDATRLESQYGIPSGLLHALVRGESNGNAAARSPVGAVGLTQLMPATAKGLGVNPYDPKQNLEGGAKYLSAQLRAFGGNVQKALAAYNAGPGAVKKYGGVPPYKETQQYVSRVSGYWKGSPRYGGTSQGVQAQQKAVQGGLRAIPKVDVPNAMPKPELQETPGISKGAISRLSNAYQDHPEYAQSVINARQRKQNALTTKYNTDMSAYEANQAAIRQANETNKLQMQMPNQYPTGGYVGTGQVVGGVPVPGKWSPNAKYVKSPSGWVKNLQSGEQTYKFLQRVGKGYGLQNDPGDYQTTGGNHAAGSHHYAGRAIDYGDARNSRDKLFSFAEWAKANAPNIKELYYNPLGWGIKNGRVIQGLTAQGHDDHLHAAW